MRKRQAVEVAIGFAGTPGGNGVAYASTRGPGGNEVLRLPFRIPRISPRLERSVPYAALLAVVRALQERGLRCVRFILPDPKLVDELSNRQTLPDALALPYVRLRCALNALEAFELRSGATDELTQRARAEVALNLAA